ncbi:hypothetical protein BHE74_00015031 [Ensete ventricosum]|nr:hypothetical protein GW17_00035531 [Ensete ventricosum]RWW76850.1 hypothetical protein BHE74_00015031 [Ensete ventricosum]RZR87192.1 hypothetical protein BHM03_00014553 [Ensete ventricosum]
MPWRKGGSTRTPLTAGKRWRRISPGRPPLPGLVGLRERDRSQLGPVSWPRLFFVDATFMRRREKISIGSRGRTEFPGPMRSTRHSYCASFSIIVIYLYHSDELSSSAQGRQFVQPNYGVTPSGRMLEDHHARQRAVYLRCNKSHHSHHG